jgi:glucose-fructose oxidoreductase
MLPQIRYAVIGLGHFAQTFVLPSFKNTTNSKLAALVSADRDKLDTLGNLYGVQHTAGYDEIEHLFAKGLVDVAYVSTANHLHAPIAERVACSGGHVLVETPMALTAEEGENMGRVAEAMGRMLMIAYRPHFEPAHMAAIELLRSCELGDVRSFNSVQSMQVRAPSTRTDPLAGGGPLHDMGVHCINAARCLFGSEPLEVFAFSDSAPEDTRFDGVEAAVSALLRFPEGRLATFTVAYDAAASSRYEVIGSRGRLVAEPAYGADVSPQHRIEQAGETRHQQFERSDQVAALVGHFSRCISDDLTPACGADEGIADLRVLDALFASLRDHRPVELARVPAPKRPEPTESRNITPGFAPPLVHAQAPDR